ncbi:hypothetical protein BU23DRAFT_568347 [Bimuria novae-zelandiae CBS 107.79]|uniref:Uncharacterized protein n=1 Tax=Bimuria novae-zelandiae CBS 107.79 TaxID=1447943 RepID=A0A6A5V7F6_9PLEO|nr:hypothetical protein BU23DRAFT_568347 [Bimuria novae-zelandiae CBS 107.79]
MKYRIQPLLHYEDHTSVPSRYEPVLPDDGRIPTALRSEPVTKVIKFGDYASGPIQVPLGFGISVSEVIVDALGTVLGPLEAMLVPPSTRVGKIGPRKTVTLATNPDSPGKTFKLESLTMAVHRNGILGDLLGGLFGQYTSGNVHFSGRDEHGNEIWQETKRYTAPGGHVKRHDAAGTRGDAFAQIVGPEKPANQIWVNVEGDGVDIGLNAAFCALAFTIDVTVGGF